MDIDLKRYKHNPLTGKMSFNIDGQFYRKDETDELIEALVELILSIVDVNESFNGTENEEE